MDTQTAVRTALQWVVSRVGLPNYEFNATKSTIPYPDLKVPLDRSHRMHEILVALRYPFDVDDVYRLIQPYNLVVERFSRFDKNSDPSLTIPVQMVKYIPMHPRRARYLFGEGLGDVNQQLAEFAYRMAVMTNEMFNCPLVSSSMGFYTSIRGTPTFGIKAGRLLGCKEYKTGVNIPDKDILVANNIGKTVTYPSILSLYDKAEALGEYEAMFALQSAIWLNDRSASTLQTAILRMYPKPNSKPYKTVQAKSNPVKVRVVLPEAVYTKGVNIIKNEANPRLDLYSLLVPWVVTAKYYRSNFANISLTNSISDGMRQKMLDSLDQLYAGALHE